MRVIGWYLLSLIILAGDQYSKFEMVERLNYSEPVTVIPDFFNLTLLYNRGAAFSFLANESGWQQYFFIGVAAIFSLVAIVWLWRMKKGLFLEPLAIALVLGGALGNLYDRVTLGYVVDFIQVYWRTSYFPAFNIADMAISCGAVLLVIDAIRETLGKKEIDNEGEGDTK